MSTAALKVSRRAGWRDGSVFVKGRLLMFVQRSPKIRFLLRVARLSTLLAALSAFPTVNTAGADKRPVVARKPFPRMDA